MRARTNEAGPGLGREESRESVEAAGPAGPHLSVEEVTSRLCSEEVEVGVRLASGREQYVGLASGHPDLDQPWELAAAASAAATQQYLRQYVSDPTPQVQLLKASLHSTGIGQEFITATVRVSTERERTDLLGSALMGSDRTRTAAAAALDAVCRYIGRFIESTEPVLPMEWDEETLGDTLDTRADEETLADPLDTRADEDPPAEEPIEHCALPHALMQPPARNELLESSETPAGYPAIGVLIGPTSVQAAVVDSSGGALAEARRATRAGSSEEVLETASEAVREALLKLNGNSARPTSIGIAVPGAVTVQHGVGIWSGAFPDWREVPVTSPFAEEFGLPVTAVGSLQATTFGEFCFGAAQGIADTLYVRVGKDIEAAILIRGLPFTASGAMGGKAGHMVIDEAGPRCACGESGCWQAVAGREALIGRVVKALRGGTPSAVGAAVDGQLSAVTPALVVRMASAGDAVARRALEETGRSLALGLANLIAIFAPQAVIVESQPPAVGAALLRAAEGALKSSPRAGLLSHCVLLSPELGDSAAVLGAAAWAARSASSMAHSTV